MTGVAAAIPYNQEHSPPAPSLRASTVVLGPKSADTITGLRDDHRSVCSSRPSADMASEAPSQSVLDPRLLPPAPVSSDANYADQAYVRGHAPARPFSAQAAEVKHDGPYYTQPRPEHAPLMEDPSSRRYSAGGYDEEEPRARLVQVARDHTRHAY